VNLIQIVTAEEGGGGSNFLVPNMTFVFELISFLVIMWVLYKYVLPPVNQAMTERQEKIKAQFDEAAQLKADAEATEKENQEQLANARAEASRIREEAREQGAQIIAQHREQAQVEAERITSNAQAQLEIERTQALNQLKGEVGAIATTLAGRIVGESLDDDDRQKRSVERFIAELEDEDEPGKSGKAKSKN
jgi:F-type H+-transporting ATPase subunit b